MPAIMKELDPGGYSKLIDGLSTFEGEGVAAGMGRLAASVDPDHFSGLREQLMNRAGMLESHQ
jgi:hypothetical protein